MTPLPTNPLQDEWLANWEEVRRRRGAQPAC